MFWAAPFGVVKSVGSDAHVLIDLHDTSFHEEMKRPFRAFVVIAGSFKPTDAQEDS